MVEGRLMAAGFRERLRAGAPLVGVWVKTPSHIVAEVLGQTSLDCVCLDAEHAPFDRMAIDASIAALRAASMPGLVRVPHLSADHVLNALDCGAAGVVAPHVKSREEAEALAAMCRYQAGGRGYAGSSRAADYTTSSMAANLDRAATETTIIAQIEDLDAVDAIDDILGVDGIDCFFIGRIDLTVALGAASPNDQAVIDAVEKVCRAGRAADKRIGMFVSDLEEIPQWINQGASFFALKSDHTFLLEGARALRGQFDQLTGAGTS
ncbi:MAG: aldolase/citrate lyase family protein [Pseudomonadota bacterium]